MKNISLSLQNTPAWKRNLAKLVAHNLPAITDKIYRIRVEDFECVNTEKPAVFAFKHRGWMDFFVATAFFRSIGKPIMIPVMEKMFKNGFIGAVILEYGGVPIKRPQDEGYRTGNIEVLSQGRAFVDLLRKGGWYAYTPEGTGVHDAVGETMQVRPLMLGSAYGQVYIVGTNCERPYHWMPGKITLRFAPYSAQGKSEGQVTVEARRIMEELSGLEHKVAQANSSPRNNR